MKFSNEAKLCELGRRLDQSWQRHQQVIESLDMIRHYVECSELDLEAAQELSAQITAPAEQ